MTKVVKDRCPDLWRQWRRFSSKAAVANFIAEAPAFLFVEPMRRAARVLDGFGAPRSIANNDDAYFETNAYGAVHWKVELP